MQITCVLYSATRKCLNIASQFSEFRGLQIVSNNKKDSITPKRKSVVCMCHMIQILGNIKAK